LEEGNAVTDIFSRGGDYQKQAIRVWDSPRPNFSGFFFAAVTPTFAMSMLRPLAFHERSTFCTL